MAHLLTPRQSVDDHPSRQPLRAYTDASQHLNHALGRVHALFQAYTLRWEGTVFANRCVNAESIQQELQRFRRTPFQWADQPLQADFQQAVGDCLENARRLREVVEQSLAQTPPSVSLPLRILQQRFAFTPLMCDVLLLALLAQHSPAHRQLIGVMQDEGNQRITWPTVEFALRILEPDVSTEQLSWATFSDDSPLTSHRLATMDAIFPNDPLPRRIVRIDDRLVDFLFGGDSLDSRLFDKTRLCNEPCDWEEMFLAPQSLTRIQRLAAWRAKHPADGLLVMLHGAYGSPKLKSAQALCTACSEELLVVDVDEALRSKDGWDEFTAHCYREARLRGAAVYWHGGEALFATENVACWAAVLRHAERPGNLTFVATDSAWEPAGQFRNTNGQFVRIDFPPPDRSMRMRIWANRLATFGVASPDPIKLEMLATAFQFTEGQIDDALTTARGLRVLDENGNALSLWNDLYEACRRQSARRLVTFAQRIEPRPNTSLADLILPEQSRRQIAELSLRIAHRDHVHHALGFEERLTLGQGLIVLFTGASGTGKTMAAALLAGDQKVDLYKVDLAAVVSKYVGETEKNLARLFTEAQDANAILFFDEADSVFGKRGDVEDARDRWANLEVNFLLQRVEDYKGTVILATNLRQNIDEAFLRRIHVIVDFPFPDADARFQIYQGCFTRRAAPPPLEQLQELAKRFPLAGGSIKNIVLDAAYRAAGEDERNPTITMRHLIAAAAREYQKLGKPVTPGEFGPEYFAWVKEDLLIGADARWT